MTDKIPEKKDSNNISERLKADVELPELKEEHQELSLIFQQYYSGPLPHPSFLKQFEEVIPGSADRIFKLLEKQSKHRQFLEKERQLVDKKSLEYSNIQTSRGQYLDFFISLAALVFGTVCSFFGAIIPGSLFGTAGVAGPAAVFVYGSRKKQ